MIQKLLLILTATLFSINIIMANELVIELKTDNFPSETSWELYDYNWNLIKTNGELTENTTHFDTIQLNTANCYVWKIYDRHGDGISYNEAPGDFNIYLDGELIYECQDPDFGDSLSVFGLGIACNTTDISVESLTFEDVQSFSPFDLEFNVFNFGPDTVTSIECTYEMEGKQSEPILITEMSLAKGELGTFQLPAKVAFTEAGITQVSLTVLKVNNQTDTFFANNSANKTVEVKNGYWKKPLHQVFTSSTCGPCRPGNENLDGILKDYDPDKYSLIKYQVNWPGNGDPYFTSEVGQMKNFYNVSAVPTMYVNEKSISPGAYTSEILDDLINEVGDLHIELGGEVISDSVFASVNIAALKNQVKNLSLRVALVEKTTYENVATNGETEFHNVFMKFLTPWRGVEITGLTAENSINLNLGEDISDTFIEEKSDLRLVAYVFESNTTNIIQSRMIDIGFTATAPSITFNIDNNATDIDTLPTIEVYSSRVLLNTYDSLEISNVKSILSFVETNSESNVEYVNFSNDNKTFTIQPTSALKAGTAYTITIDNAISDELVPINKTTLTFTTVKTVGIIESTKHSLEVYPNPVNSGLYINSKLNSTAVIVDVSGQVVKTILLYQGVNQVNVTDLHEGVYFIKVQNNNSVKQFVKVK